MATYEELIQSGYNRPQALRILKEGSGGGDTSGLQTQINELSNRITQLETEIDGGA